jgi:hypothetical protein
VTGPGSDLSEVPVVGCEPAALEPVAVPRCPPGPAALARASRSIWWQAISDSRRLRDLIASRGVFPAATLRSTLQVRSEPGTYPARVWQERVVSG